MVYTETKPRGPIFIDFSGPGPAYGAPGLTGADSHDPRSQHTRGPAFSMGGKRRERREEDKGPGPIYNPDSSLTNRGRSEGMSTSLKGRYKDRAQGASGPGPGAYSPNTSSLSGPAYSLGGRYGSRRRGDDTPGPNVYVPSFASQEGKGASLKGKYREPNRKDTSQPGPQTYKPSSGMDRYGRRTAPEVSLKGRNFPQSKAREGPGPGAYEPQTEGLSSNRAEPAWSLSSRHKEPSDKNNSPGPGTYAPPRPSDTASAPAYSIGGKRKQPRKDDGPPGPGTYNPSPEIGVRGRMDGTAATLKGRYQPRKTTSDQSPGPGAYGLTSPGDVGPAYTMTGKPREKNVENGQPGPNSYFPSVDRDERGPTLKGRHRDVDQSTAAPGPGTYSVDPDSKVHPGPAYSMAGKWVDDRQAKTGESSPGPATYNPKSSLKNDDGGVSMGVRHSRAKYIPTDK